MELSFEIEVGSIKNGMEREIDEERRRWCSEAIFENKRIGRLFMNPGSLVKTNMRLGAMPNTCEMDIRVVVVVSFYSFLGSIT